MSNGERWKFYKAHDLDLPTMKELKNVKALIIWSSASSPSFKETSDGGPNSWIKPIIKLIKKAYRDFPNLKILGISLGQLLVANALGAIISKKSLDDAEKLAHNLNRGIFCGKD